MENNILVHLAYEKLTNLILCFLD